MTDFELLLHELGQMPDVVRRASVEKLLRSFAGRRLTIDSRAFKRTNRTAAASAMLASGMQRRQTVVAISERFGISERSALRYVAQARRAANAKARPNGKMRQPAEPRLLVGSPGTRSAISAVIP